MIGERGKVEIGEVGRGSDAQCKKDDEEKIISKMRMSSFYRRILRRDKVMVNGSGVIFGCGNGLLGDIPRLGDGRDKI
ncbi:hypothetical protein Tco_0526667 [Tanacetum coccineum]